MENEGDEIFKDTVQEPLFPPEQKAVISSEENLESQQVPIDEKKTEGSQESKDGTNVQYTEDGIFIPFDETKPRDLDNNNYSDPQWTRDRDIRKQRRR